MCHRFRTVERYCTGGARGVGNSSVVSAAFQAIRSPWVDARSVSYFVGFFGDLGVGHVFPWYHQGIPEVPRLRMEWATRGSPAFSLAAFIQTQQ